MAAAGRARLDTGDAGYVQLYAEPDSGMLIDPPPRDGGLTI
jgi:hypothetical protein